MKLTARIRSLQVSACNLLARAIAHFVVGCFILAAALPAAAQVKNYGFTVSDGVALTTLTAPVSLIGAGVDDGSSSLTTIPFLFEWNGAGYNQFSVSSNGLLRLGSGVSTSSNNSLASVSGVLSPFWDDLQTNTQGSATGVQYQVVGYAPNRTLVIQWTAYNYSSASNVQFQCALSETSNVIAFTYGSGAGGSASIGMSYGNTDFSSVTVASGSISSTTADNQATFPGAGKRYEFTVPPACAGIPAAGATVSSSTAVCATTSFSLSLENQSTERNISYQWQFSTDGSTYTDVSGATGSRLSRTQAETRWYRCRVTCTNSNLSATSTPVQVTMKPGSDCYCKPPENPYCGFHITHVSTSGGLTNFNNNTTCSGTYSDYRSTKSASQYPGQPVTMSFSSSGNNYGYSVWIDFNNNGSYEPSENVITRNNAGTVITATFTVPASAAPGTFNMRVRGDQYYYSYYGYYYPSAPSDPCNALQYGETEDYSFTVVNPNDCSGAPTPGSTISGVAGPVCAGTNFTLSLQNSAVEKGLSYQWQSSTDGVNFTAISGATAARYTTSQVVTTWYRCLVSCTNSGLSTASAPVEMEMNSVDQCYCVPASSNYTGTSIYIAHVSTTGGVTNFSNESRRAPLAYTYYKSAEASQYQGGTVTVSLASSETDRLAFSAWIDFNDDGFFAAGEKVFSNPNAANSTTLSSSFSVPLLAPAGKHRMRIRADIQYYGAPVDPCNTLNYGETEDYIFTVLPLAACGGTPAPGNTLISGGNPVCAGNTFTLSLQNDIAEGGLSYQWQSSSDGTTYTDIAGATAPTYNTVQSTATYYRCVVRCSGSGLSVSTTPLLVSQKAGINCYCIPDTTQNAGYNYINLVATSGGVTNFSNASHADPSGYSDFSASFSVAQYQGRTVTINFGSFGNYFNYAVWIDFNDNGIFENTERVIQNASNTNPGTFTVASDAPAGTHRMRVRGDNWLPADACATLGNGETEDYSFTVIVPPPSCTGTPAPGNTLVSGSSQVCAGAGFKLSLQNKFFLSGISYQWQSSTDGVTYTDISGATDSIHLTSQAATTWYRCRVRCNSSGLTATSSPLQVSMSAPVNCYCMPAAATTSYVITNVTVTGGVASFNNSSGTSGPNYSNYTTMAASQYRGGTVNLELSFRVQSDFAVWIDFNDDGAFDAAEQVVLVENATGNANVPASFVVPATAAAGTHRMRISSQVNWNTGPVSACGSAEGETEDYSFTVLAPPACTGTPAPGNTMSSGANPVCSGIAFTLSLQNNMTATGLSFQWQSSANGVTYVNIAGATAASYTTTQTATTWYRCVVTCAGSGLSGTSTPLQVTANPMSNCYCTPLASQYSCSNMFLTSVSTSGGISNFSNTSSCAFPSFADYSAGKIASQYQGAAITLTFGSSGQAMRYAAWIDFNDDGIFANGEKVLENQNSANALSDVSASFVVPVGASPGTHRMRVRAEATGYDLSTACSQLMYGETEDYGFTVLQPATGCTGLPVPGSSLASEGASVCAGKNFILSLQNTFTEGGITYQWQVSSDGSSFTNIAGAVFATYSTSQSATQWYRCVVTCTNSARSALSTAVKVSMQTGAGCYCTPPVSTYACTDAYLKNVTITGGLTNFDNSSACSPGSYSYYSGITASQYQGTSVTVSFSSSGAAMRYIVWIDFNDDGQFGPSELVSTSWNNDNALNNVSAQLMIPATAPTGTHRMRVRAEHAAYPLDSDPCKALKYGETEDYEFTVLAKPSDACTSAPAPGNTLTSGSNPVCAGTGFTLSIQNILVGTGYTYQWQSSADGINYTAIAGATAASYATAQLATTWYRCLVTCATGNLSGYSTPLQITMNPVANCYCVPTPSSSPCMLYISNVTTTEGITNFNNTSACAPRSYADYSGVHKVSQYQGRAVTLHFNSATDVFRYSVWVDYNDNGVFETVEQVIVNQNSNNTLSGLSARFTVPSTAPAGVHRMRVRGERNWYAPPADACNMLNYGETEDYSIEVLESPPCAGVPAPGNTLVSGTTIVCSGESFTLSVQDVPVQKNLSYQWQFSDDGITYTNIRNATDTIYTTSQTVATWYRCLVICSGGSSATTAAVKMTMNNPVNCYCMPVTSGNTCAGGAAYISNVSTTGGVTNFTNATACAPTSYTNYSATRSVSQYQGQAVNFSFATMNGSMPYSVWVDFNDDGYFSTAEKILSGVGNTASYTLPLNALPGTHRMRVRADLYTVVNDPCNQLSSGETEDYGFTVLAASACSGTPAPGNTLTSGANPVCAQKTFTLSLQNNPLITGLSYQWQSSSNGTTYTNIAGATSASYTTAQTSATYYRCVVTCAGTGLSGNSNPVYITMNSIANCFCTPAASLDKCKVYISNVSTTGGLTNFSNATTCAATSYTNYTSTRIASQYQGQLITVSLAATGGTMGFSVWIDFDDNGVFEHGEKMISNATTATSFRVPSTARTGTHRMRVRAESALYTNYTTTPITYSYYANGVTDPCATLNYGETEDYGFTVVAQPACTGTPAPGNTLVGGSNPVCAGVPFTLSLSNNLVPSGITYQWQSSVNGAAYYNIPDATAATYTASQATATWYRCVVACAASGLSGNSTPVQVTMNPATNCYCTPSASGNNCAAHISNVSTTGGATNFTNATGCTASSYTNYSATRIASQVQGGSITLNFTSVSYYFQYAVWIDWNDNGIFEATEKVIINDNATDQLTVSSTFTVPLLAPAGTHRMRVRGDIYTPSDPCDALSYGETEDYAFTVVSATACTGTPAPGNTVTSGANPICWGTAFTLSLSTNLMQTGLKFQWQSSTNGVAYTNIPNANFRTYTTTQTAATYYRCVVTCVNSGQSGNSTALLVNMNTAANCYCTPAVSYTACGTRGYISNVTTTGGITNFANATACAATSYTNYSATRVVSQYQGQDVNMSFTSASGPLGYSIFVDYDDNGIFDASERVYSNDNSGYQLSVTGSFRIPSGARPGTHRMRVRADYYYYNGWYSYYSYPAAPYDACSKLDNGETEDYALTVVVPPACSGVPVAGTAAASSTSVCGSGGVTLSLTGGSSSATGMIYQWQVSRDGAAFINIKDANSRTYNSGSLSGMHTYAYRCVATCTNSGLSANSNTVTVTAYETVAVTPSSVSVCPGTSTTLTASPAGKVYSWSPGGQTTQNITVTAPGTYTVSVTQGACVTTASATITALPVPVISSITATPSTVCAEGSATLSVAATAGTPATYCTPASNCTFPDYISNVTFGTINRTSTCDNATNGYSLHTATNPIIMAGNTLPLSVSTGGDREGVAVWIDFNQNGTFENSELVYHNYAGSNPATYSGNITIPATAVNGITRMRVRCQYLSDPSVTGGPCYAITNGETEDYQITIRGGVDPLNYSWSPATYLSTINGSTITASGISANTTYTVKATSAAGCFTTANVPVTVLPLAQGSLTGNTICSGGAGQLTFTAATGTGPFTVVYNDGASDITVNNVSSGVPFAVSASPSATASYTMVSVTGSNGCARTTGFTGGTATITVVQAPSIAQQPQPVNLCAGSNANFTVTASGTGLNYQWQLSTNGGVSWTNLANNATYSGVLTNTLSVVNPPAGMTGYRFRAIVSNSCTTTSSSATLTVSAAPAISQQPQDITVCAGGGASFVVTATGTALSYQWQTSADGVVWNDIAGATTAILNLASVSDADNGKRFRVSVTAGDCTPSLISSSVTLTVPAAPAISAQPLPVAICAGSNASFTVTATGAGINYQWQMSTDGSTWTNIAGATTASLNLTAVTATQNGNRYRVIVSGNCLPAVTSTAATLTVGAAFTIGSQPQPATVCVGDPANFTVGASGTGLSYQWQTSPNGTTWSNIAGATGATLTLTNVMPTQHNHRYRVIVSGDCAAPYTSAAAILTVNQPAAISMQPQPQTVCAGAAANFAVSATGTGLSFQWQWSADGTAWNNISGATASNYSLANVTAASNGNLYRVVVSSGCASAINSNAAVLNVQTAPVIAAQPQPQALCSGTTASFAVTATGTNISYQWQRSSDGNNWNNISGATSASLVLTNVTASQSGSQFRVLISGSCAPAVTSNAALLTVKPAAQVTTHPQPVTACSGTDVIFSATATGSNISYQWQSSTDGAVWTNIAGANSPDLSINNIGAAENGAQYRVTVNSDCAPASISAAATLTVVMPAVIAGQPQDAATCEGGTAVFRINAGGSGLSFQWQSGDGATWSDISGATASTLSLNNVTLTQHGTRYRVLVSSGSCATPIASDGATLTVNAVPVIAGITAGSPVCVGQDLNFGFSVNGNATVSASWNFGDGNTANTPQPVHRYTASGSYTVTLAVTNSNGCTVSATKTIVVGAVPVSSFTLNNAQQCITANAFTFTNSSTGAGTYNWDFGDGQQSTVQDPTHVYAAAGSYTVVLTATSAGGCISVARQTVSVQPMPAASFSVSNAAQCMSGNEFAFSNTSTGTDLVYNWNFGDGATAQSADAKHSYAAPGRYTITLTVSTAAGCTQAYSSDVDVFPQPLPKFTINNSSQCLNGNQFQFTNGTVAAGTVSYTWNFGDGTISNSVSPTHSYATAGTYAVQLVVHTGNGCADSVQQVVTVNAGPDARFTVNNGMQCVAANRFEFRRPAASAGDSHAWELGDGTQAASASVNHSYTNAGTYRVTLKVTNAAGCIDSSSITIEVTARPVAAFTTNTTTQCLNGNEFRFTNTSNNNGLVGYHWIFGDGTLASSPDAVRKFAQAGTYEVKLVATMPGGCTSDTARAEILVHPHPVVHAGADKQVPEGKQVIMDPRVTGDELTYRWSPTTYLVTRDTARNPVFAPLDDTRYTLMVTGVGGCTATDDVMVRVLKKPLIPNAFSPNNDGVHDTWVVKYLDRYPECTVEIYNRYGIKVFHSNGYTTPWNGSFKGAPLPVGTYYYVIDPKNGTEKFTGSITLLR